MLAIDARSPVEAAAPSNPAMPTAADPSAGHVTAVAGEVRSETATFSTTGATAYSGQSRVAAA